MQVSTGTHQNSHLAIWTFRIENSDIVLRREEALVDRFPMEFTMQVSTETH